MRPYLLQRQALDAIPLLDETSYRAYQQIETDYFGREDDRDDEHLANEATANILSQLVDEIYVQRYCFSKIKDILGIIHEILSDYREMLQGKPG